MNACTCHMRRRTVPPFLQVNNQRRVQPGHLRAESYPWKPTNKDNQELNKYPQLDLHSYMEYFHGWPIAKPCRRGCNVDMRVCFDTREELNAYLFGYLGFLFKIDIYDTLTRGLRRCGHEMCKIRRPRQYDSMETICILVYMLDKGTTWEDNTHHGMVTYENGICIILMPSTRQNKLSRCEKH